MAPALVIPAKAGIHFDFALAADNKSNRNMDPGLRWDDEPHTCGFEFALAVHNKRNRKMDPGLRWHDEINRRID